MSASFITLIAVLYLMFLFSYCHGANSSLTPGQSIRDGETIISPSETFELGFFSPGDSPNRYLGIWYNKISLQTVVWVANRENPVTDSSGVLTLADDGNLVVLDGRGRSLWSSNSSNPSKNATAYFLDTGNLVLSIGEVQDPDMALWQSFDNPTDAFLPGMRVRLSPRSKWDLFTSWKSESDPSRGNFSLGVDPQGLLEVVVWRGTEKHWRSGLWTGQVFIGVPSMMFIGFHFSQEAGGSSFFSYTVYNSEIVRFRLSWDGTEEQLRWDDGRKKWTAFWAQPTSECEVYNMCGAGANGNCSTSTSPICSCLQGFEPKSRAEWDNGNWSGGCVRRTELQCERNISSLGVVAVAGDRFLQMDGVKLPDQSVYRPSDNKSHCEAICSNNCSCKAYAYVPGIECLTWGEELFDVGQLQENGQTFHLRLAASELDFIDNKEKGKNKDMKVILPIASFVGLLIVGLCIFIYTRWINKDKGKRKTSSMIHRTSSVSNELADSKKHEEPDVPMFKYENLVVATNDFDLANRLGEGGFGSVYKGKLPTGEEIAVKRLSKSSGQGTEEFKNEVTVISRLQHRNLVRLLGFCIEQDEKMLIYEYMPNKSLDVFASDPIRKALMGWRKCFQIIEGIGRGVLYLHRDSRLRVIHRDLKPSNILLDKDLNPKIADFGMARIVGGDELQANTKRVVGTYGYMSPEYAMDGLFSEKSDVYSFGVLLLEIVTGMKNTGFYNHEESISLIQHVWKLWNKGKTQEIIDPTISEPCFEKEMLRCIQLGLLCVQESAVDRPSMSSIISMLTTEISAIPIPKQPAFTGTQVTADTDSSNRGYINCSTNNSITLEGR